MSTIYRDMHLEPTEAVYPDIANAPCDICGTARPDAFWIGGRGLSSVVVCYRCAIETLPRLIADAIGARRNVDYGTYQQTLAHVVGAYWHGAAAVLSRPDESHQHLEIDP